MRTTRRNFLGLLGATLAVGPGCQSAQDLLIREAIEVANLIAMRNVDEGGVEPSPHDRVSAENYIRMRTPAAGSETDTIGFRALARQHPELNTLRKCVGQISYLDNGQWYTIGSATLLNEGTVVYCAHEKIPLPTKISFSPSNNQRVEIALRNTKFNDRLDLAFATITDPDFVRRHGLVPARQDAPSSYGRLDIGKKLVCLGWPGHERRLHATTGFAEAFRENEEVMGMNGEIHISDCKVGVRGLITPGMSGCPVFHNGRWLGIANTGMADEHLSADNRGSYTPADIIQVAATIYQGRSRRPTPIAARAMNQALPTEACAVRRNWFRYIPRPD